MVALNEALGSVRGTAVDHEDLQNLGRLCDETIETFLDASGLVEYGEENAHSFGLWLVANCDA
jgi:hypothetical protein